MLKSIPGYSIFCVFSEVKTTSLIIPFMAIVVLFYIIYGSKNRLFIGNPSIVVITLLLSIGSFLQGSDLSEIIQGLYIVLIPILIFKTILGFDKVVVQREEVLKILVAIGIINIVPALYTFYNYGLGGEVYFYHNGYRVNRFDVVNGFFSDAHQYSIYFYFLSVVVFGYYCKMNSKYIFLSLIFFGVAFLGFNAKGLLVFLLLLLLMVLIFTFRKRMVLGVLAVSSIFLLFSILYGIVIKYDSRIELFKNISLQDAPVVNPIVKSIDVFITYPEIALFGAGVGNYGTTIAIARANKNGEMSTLARKYNGYSIWSMTSKDDSLVKSNEFISFLSFNINTFTSMLVELGLIVSVLIFGFYYRIIKYYFTSMITQSQYWTIDFALVFYFIFIFINSLLVLWGSFDDEVAIIPILILSAYEIKKRYYPAML
jgi:hypothetical protein